MTRAAICLCVLAAAACGSSGGPGAMTGTPTAPTTPSSSVTTTAALTGTTRQTSTGGFNGCTGDSHTLTVQDGEVAITLVATSDPAGALSVQICQSGSDSICSIKQQRINVGQRLTGVRTGTSSQIVKMLPFACVFGGAFDATPITYSVSVTYQQ